jgi:hypothetical protein
MPCTSSSRRISCASSLEPPLSDLHGLLALAAAPDTRCGRWADVHARSHSGAPPCDEAGRPPADDFSVMEHCGESVRPRRSGCHRARERELRPAELVRRALRGQRVVTADEARSLSRLRWRGTSRRSLSMARRLGPLGVQGHEPAEEHECVCDESSAAARTDGTQPGFRARKDPRPRCLIGARRHTPALPAQLGPLPPGPSRVGRADFHNGSDRPQFSCSIVGEDSDPDLTTGIAPGRLSS